MIRFIVALLCLTSVLSVNAEEREMNNAVGGKIVIGDGKCQLEELKVNYPYAGYLTSGAPGPRTSKNYAPGCWYAPTEGPPKEGMVPIVTFAVKDPYSGEIFTQEYFLDMFKPSTGL